MITEDYVYVMIDNKITHFETDHFSDYAIVNEETLTNPKTGLISNLILIIPMIVLVITMVIVSKKGKLSSLN